MIQVKFVMCNLYYENVTVEQYFFILKDVVATTKYVVHFVTNSGFE